MKRWLWMLGALALIAVANATAWRLTENRILCDAILFWGGWSACRIYQVLLKEERSRR